MSRVETVDRKNKQMNKSDNRVGARRSRLARLMAFAMLSCEEAGRLTSDSLDEPLTFRQKISLYLHLRLCRWCRRNAEQLARIRQVLASEETGEPDSFETALSEEARRRLQKALDERLK